MLENLKKSLYFFENYEKTIEIKLFYPNLSEFIQIYPLHLTKHTEFLKLLEQSHKFRLY